MNNKLELANLKTRRAFLIAAARKVAAPVVIAYTINKTSPKLFAREPR